MKTKWLYNSILSSKVKDLLLQKMFRVALIVALLAAFLPAFNVLAAPAVDDDIDYGDLDYEWKVKREKLRFENLFYAQVKILPSDYKNADDRARAQELLNKYGSALKKANEVVAAHLGFDQEGDVLNEAKAYESIKELALQLHTMRGVREKLAEEGLTPRRIK